MSKSSTESLEAFLRRQNSATLADILIELAGENDAVLAGLRRRQLADQPDKLTAEFKKRLSAWKRSSKYHDYRDAGEFGRELQAWLDQVGRELVPKDPPAAVALFESFIEADSSWFEHADDSNGCIGDAMRAACVHWLRAASQCETPAEVWPPRLVELFEADQYGTRETLLQRADVLLDEPALRQLVSLFESRMACAIENTPANERPPYEVFKRSAGLSLLSRALGDPDVEVRAVLSYSPQPNALQQERFARAYLDADRPEDALTWLQPPWESLSSAQRSLLADVLKRLGRFDESASIRQELFEATLSVWDFQRWLEHLPESGHADAIADAHRLATEHTDPVTAALLLLAVGDGEAAEAKLVADPARINGENYGTLVPLAKALRADDRARGETAVYRALLQGVLGRAYARAYSHAARYWMRLREIADTGLNLLPLQSHEVFEAQIRAKHARKSSFWAHVNGKRAVVVDDELDDESMMG